jgi:hypothetical protein
VWTDLATEVLVAARALDVSVGVVVDASQNRLDSAVRTAGKRRRS